MSLPSIASPTGIVTGPPALRTRSPRLSPVVGSSAIARAVREFELGLDFGDDDPTFRIHDFDGVVDRRRSILEHEVDHRAADRCDPPLELVSPAIERPSRIWRAPVFARGRRVRKTILSFVDISAI